VSDHELLAIGEARKFKQSASDAHGPKVGLAKDGVEHAGRPARPRIHDVRIFGVAGHAALRARQARGHGATLPLAVLSAADATCETAAAGSM
jgi:hypothetical protein